MPDFEHILGCGTARRGCSAQSVWQAKRSCQQRCNCVQGKHLWAPGGVLAIMEIRSLSVCAQDFLRSANCKLITMVALGDDLQPSGLADWLVVSSKMSVACVHNAFYIHYKSSLCIATYAAVQRTNNHSFTLCAQQARVTIDVNYHGTADVTEALVPLMPTDGRSRVVSTLYEKERKTV
eukprot:1146814-Pelagomonas_calceolata.AAC.6